MEVKYDRAVKSFIVKAPDGSERGSIEFKFTDSYNDKKHEDESVDLFSYTIYHKKDVKESLYPQVYVHDDSAKNHKKRIGWMIPFNTIVTEDEDILKEIHLSCFVFHAFLYLLSQPDFASVSSLDDMREVVDDKYKDTCLLVVYNSFYPADKIDRLEIPLASYGYYTKLSNYANSFIVDTNEILLYPTDGLLQKDGTPIDNYFIECIRTHLDEKEPVLKFMYLYQIIEVLFSRVLIKQLQAFIDEIKNPQGSFKDVSEEINHIKKEIDRWNAIERMSGHEDRDYTKLDDKCNEFLRRKENPYVHPKSIYMVRNQFIHRFRIATQNYDDIREINQLFELYLIDLLCAYKES